MARIPSSPRTTRTAKTARPSPAGRPASTWKPVSSVPRADVRRYFSAIVRYAAAGNKVRVAVKAGEKTYSYSAFISATDFEQLEPSFDLQAKEVPIDELKRDWVLEREQVELTGQPRKITKNGVFVAALVPTERALKVKVPRTQEALRPAWNRAVDQRLSLMEDRLATLPANMPDAKQFERFLALAERMFGDWREVNGLQRDVPG